MPKLTDLRGPSARAAPFSFTDEAPPVMLVTNREINREFRDSGPSEGNFVARNHCAAATFYEIPYAN
jgi:hypothetical protein